MKQAVKRVHVPSDMRAKSHVIGTEVERWNVPERMPTLCGRSLEWTGWRLVDIGFPTCVRCRAAARQL